jgi:hypothetical protein
MKLTKRQMAILYQLILNDMERVTRKTPPVYVDELQALEVLFSKEYDKQR